MSETKLGLPNSEVPKATKVRLFDEVARLNVPHANPEDRGHPLPKLLAIMKDEHPEILDWGSNVGTNINLGFGGTPENQTNEKMAFDNAFIVAYGLIRTGYEESGREMPGAHKPPEWYMWIRDEPYQSIEGMFQSLNLRQRALAQDYPDLLEAMQTWAAERIPGYDSGYIVGAVGIAAAEMYYAFIRTEETASLERTFQESPDEA